MAIGDSSGQLSAFGRGPGFSSASPLRSRDCVVALARSAVRRVLPVAAEIKIELRRRWPATHPGAGQWLSAVLRGHYAYYAVARQLRRGKRGMDSSDLWANYQQVEITTRHAQRAEDTPIELEKGAESTSGGAHRLGAARSATALDQAPTVTPEEPHPIQS